MPEFRIQLWLLAQARCESIPVGEFIAACALFSPAQLMILGWAPPRERAFDSLTARDGRSVSVKNIQHSDGTIENNVN